MPIASLLRDRLGRLLVAQQEPQYQALKLITRNKTLPLNVRMKAQFELQKFPRYARAVSIRNRCIVNGKARVRLYNSQCKGVLGAYKMNHMAFREQALSGLLPGVRKSVW